MLFSKNTKIPIQYITINIRHDYYWDPAVRAFYHILDLHPPERYLSKLMHKIEQSNMHYDAVAVSDFNNYARRAGKTTNRMVYALTQQLAGKKIIYTSARSSLIKTYTDLYEDFILKLPHDLRPKNNPITFRIREEGDVHLVGTEYGLVINDD